MHAHEHEHTRSHASTTQIPDATVRLSACLYIQLEWYIQLDDGGWRVERFVRHFATQQYHHEQEQKDQQQQEAVEQEGQQQQEMEQQQEQNVSDEEEDQGQAPSEIASEIESSESDIEQVLAYRFKFNQHQWQVRWRSVVGETAGETAGETPSGGVELSWERWGVLDTPDLREAAEALRSLQRGENP